MNKKELTEKRRRKIDDKESPKLSENEEFLTIILNSNIEERKKLSVYIARINQNIRVLRNIITELK